MSLFPVYWAVYTHFLTQIPHPMHRNSEMNEILSVGLTSIHNLPVNLAIQQQITAKRLHG
ncbi:hypothetical protein C8J56DRAFT_770112 [Mycena floridula]|nr:hypothetical protein C8J56DRAFT_770112 [Mycena floridula]